MPSFRFPVASTKYKALPRGSDIYQFCHHQGTLDGCQQRSVVGRKIVSI